MTTVIRGTDDSASTPALTGTDADTGIFFPAANTMAMSTGGSERVRVDSSGNVGIGTTSPASGVLLDLKQPTAGTDLIIGLSAGTGARAQIRSVAQGSADDSVISFQTTSGGSTAERARIDSSGNLLVGRTSVGESTNGITLSYSGVSSTDAYIQVSNTRADGGGSLFIADRRGSDGVLIGFQQAGVSEGNISVSGSTVSYNGGHLSRWAQTTTAKDESLVKGTVLSNLDEMNVYIAPTTYWTEEDELPEGVNVGDVKVETHEVQNEQLNKVKVSDVEGDANVAGVFVNWTYDEAHDVDEINMAMTGDMIIRIAQGVVVQKGDLLMSAGDGTAKPQGDDIVRSKTVAKVTSNHVTCTYADGSFCVPCVLMAC